VKKDRKSVEVPVLQAFAARLNAAAKLPAGKHFNPQNGDGENRCKRAGIRLWQIERTMGEIAVYFKQSPATKGPTCRILTGQSCLEHRIFKGFLHHGT
jgi:hypothetical protein